MRIRLISVTQKTPRWVNEGFQEYAKRFTHPSLQLELVEIPAEKRGVNADVKRILNREGEKILQAIKPQHLVIALDVKGDLWSTEQLAEQITKWQHNGQHIDLLIGGPEGLDHSCTQRASQFWSLSPLTFPHPLVRIIVAEQLFRAHSILTNHPYHRG